MAFFNDDFMYTDHPESTQSQANRVLKRIKSDENEWKAKKRRARTNQVLEEDLTALEIRTLKSNIETLTEENYQLKEKFENQEKNAENQLKVRILAEKELKMKIETLEKDAEKPKIRPKSRTTVSPCDLEEEKLLLEIDEYLHG